MIRKELIMESPILEKTGTVKLSSKLYTDAISESIPTKPPNIEKVTNFHSGIKGITDKEVKPYVMAAQVIKPARQPSTDLFGRIFLVP